MRLLTFCLVLLFAVAQQAAGDNAPAPAPDNWSKTVENLANALSEGDPGSLLAVLTDDAAINTFESKNSGAAQMLARTKKGMLISSLHYDFAPETVANDIAE